MSKSPRQISKLSKQIQSTGSDSAGSSRCVDVDLSNDLRHL